MKLSYGKCIIMPRNRELMANIYIGQINTMFGSIGLQILKLSYRNWWYFKWKADKEDRDVQPREIYINICGKIGELCIFDILKLVT